MGRGRAKAKQTKVARDLKYNTGGTDLERLKAEGWAYEGFDYGGEYKPRPNPPKDCERFFGG